MSLRGNLSPHYRVSISYNQGVGGAPRRRVTSHRRRITKPKNTHFASRISAAPVRFRRDSMHNSSFCFGVIFSTHLPGEEACDGRLRRHRKYGRCCSGARCAFLDGVKDQQTRKKISASCLRAQSTTRPLITPSTQFRVRKAEMMGGSKCEQFCQVPYTRV